MLNNKGITLVELLVTIAISGFVFLLAFSFYFFGASSFTHAGRQTDIQADTRLVSDFIISEIRNARQVEILNTVGNDGDSHYLYLDNNRIYYKEPDPAGSVGKTDSIIQSLDLEVSSQGDAYLLSFTIESQKGTQQYTLDSEVLLNNIRSATEATGTAIRFVKPN